MQWGYHGSISSEKTATVTLPVAFTSAGYFVACQTPTLNGASRGVVGARPDTTTTVVLTNGNDNIADARWFAVGK